MAGGWQYVVDNFEEGRVVHCAPASFLRLTGGGGQSLKQETERMLEERLSEETMVIPGRVGQDVVDCHTWR